jgi:hypothetical protein
MVLALLQLLTLIVMSSSILVHFCFLISACFCSTIPSNCFTIFDKIKVGFDTSQGSNTYLLLWFTFTSSIVAPPCQALHSSAFIGSCIFACPDLQGLCPAATYA